MLVSYYLPGNSLAPPSGLRARGDSAHREEEQSLFDPFPYGWSPEEELGIFNTVHSPHTAQPLLQGTWVKKTILNIQHFRPRCHSLIRFGCRSPLRNAPAPPCS